MTHPPPQIVACTAFGFVAERTGINSVARAIGAAPFWNRFVRHAGDGQIAAWAIWLGWVIPAVCFYELWHAWAFGFEWRRAIIYNFLRIGPMYMNFAHS